MWSHANATRPIIVQDHIDPVPLRVIKTNIKTLGLTLMILGILSESVTKTNSI